MAQITVCDICGRDIPYLKKHEYLVRVRKRVYSFEDKFWQRLEICDDCQKAIINLIKEHKKDDV